MTPTVRPAVASDAVLLLTLIRELAEYERMTDEVVITEEDVRRDGFGARPKFRVLLAEWEGQAAGYAFFFEIYSSFKGRTGLFLEDLYVRPQFRKNGIGKALLAGVANVAVQEDVPFVRWEVLDWNALAIDFYRGLGATFREQWKSVSLAGPALQKLAQGAPWLG